ncbi:hypothetical protein FNF28_05277 [Cafeteria roenbergensis]|nr:hypothetical protein FNF28_05277 [Cafeteria roenbergensis]
MTEAEQLEEGRRVLLATGWQLDAQCADRTVAARFRLAIKLGQQWEEGIYRLGRYFDSVLQSLMVAVSAGDLQSSVLESRDKHVTLVVQHFCRGLRAARSQARHVYEMLPRVLTLVLDYGAACEREARSGSASRTSSASSTAAAAAAAGGGASVGAVLASDPQSVYAKPSEECLQRLLDRLEGLLATMTANRWLTALPQLTSRICHRHGRVAGFIQRTLQLVSLLFPRQSHWSIVSLSRSTVRLRAERAHQVLDLIRGSAGLPGHQAQVGLYNSTVKALVACARSTTAADSKQLNISWSVSRRAFDSAGANGVLIPNLRQLTVSVPEAPDPLDGGRGWGGAEGGAAAAGAVSNAGAGSSAGGASAAAAGSPMGSAPGGTGATAGTQGIAGSGDEAEALAEGEVAAAAALVINGGRVDQLAPGSLSLSGFGEPDSQVLVAELEPTVAVMSSKEQPKRVTAMGTDGRRHPFLCKTERRGDLRKDARVMEFATTVNRLLRRDAEGRRRALALRAYAVVVLSEDTGLAEWVQGTSTFRAEVTKVYAANKLKDPMVVVTETYKTYQKEQDMFAHDKKTMATRFRFRWLPLFPALFHQWFPLTFAGPAEWLASRTEFARSAAAWSITGHIIGLGDRHGENLLIDTRSGACVHVDFDCIFDKGLKLRRAEVVPFRLTGNMLDGMGLAGHEGTFRRTAEACLRVFRSERDVLLSVLEPFVHDPLVEWNRKSKRGSDSGGGRGSDRVGSDGGMLPLTGVGGETVQMEGLEVMRRTAERIAGFYNYGHTAGEVALASGRAAGNPGAGGTPLSVEGQAHRLIAEATSHENLCRLYVGWLPWL